VVGRRKPDGPASGEHLRVSRFVQKQDLAGTEDGFDGETTTAATKTDQDDA
jgi:hypothetical protein